MQNVYTNADTSEEIMAGLRPHDHPRIDPGLRVTGFGLIAVDGYRADYVASGCIRAAGSDLPQRRSFSGVQALIEQHRPDEAAIENALCSAMPLRHSARPGAWRRHLRMVTSGLMHEYTDTDQVVGGGQRRCRQAQVRHMVCALLKLRGEPRLDASDALACALSHLNFSRTLARTAQRLAAAERRLP